MSLRAATLLLLGLAGCAPAPGRSDPAGYAPAAGRDEEGLASWYGAAFHGRTTASGIPFDRHAMVAAHPTLPFGTRVRVHRLSTGGAVEVEIVDRGPAAGPRRAGVVIDLSEAAAEQLGFIREGRTRVRIEVLPDPAAAGETAD
ncbi:MAG: septal ring lytic transglycosylase RlpA family protein [Gemmatimonadota bacterium]